MHQLSAQTCPKLKDDASANAIEIMFVRPMVAVEAKKVGIRVTPAVKGSIEFDTYGPSGLVLGEGRSGFEMGR